MNRMIIEYDFFPVFKNFQNVVKSKIPDTQF